MLRKLSKMRKRNKRDSIENTKTPVSSDRKIETKLEKEIRLEDENEFRNVQSYNTNTRR
jgi:hypothetical protein